MHQVFAKRILFVRFTVIRSTESRPICVHDRNIVGERLQHLQHHIVPMRNGCAIFRKELPLISRPSGTVVALFGPTSYRRLPHTETCRKRGHYRDQLRQGLTVEPDTRKEGVRHIGDQSWVGLPRIRAIDLARLPTLMTLPQDQRDRVNLFFPIALGSETGSSTRLDSTINAAKGNFGEVFTRN
jgi:hypothetical protein